MDQKVNPIQPPPSVDDLLALGSEGRLGQVDFANRLVPEVGSAEQGDAPLATVTPVRRHSVSAVPALPTEPAPAVEALLESTPEPVVEPEPEVAPEPEAVVEPVVEPEPEPEPPAAKPAPRSRPKPAAKPVAKAKPTTKLAPKPAAAKPAKPARRTPAPKVAPVETEPVIEPAEVAEVVVAEVTEPVVPAILPIANLSGDAVSASAAHDDELFAAEVPASPAVASVTGKVIEVTEDEAPTLRVPLERAQSPWRLARQASPRPAAPQAHDEAYLGSSVQEVADAAIERLRDAENATLQHLTALEAEAARRAELLTAQAELDAELIRITARREAHAIISAARSQAGLSAPSSRDGRQLAEISDAVSRFAESIESSLALQPHSNQGDHA